MSGLLLVGLLAASGGFQLGDSVEHRGLTLLGGRIQLVEDHSRALDAMNKDQLAAELFELQNAKPSLVGPIVLLSIGGGLSLFSLYFFGLTGLGTYGEAFAIAGGAVFLIPGVVLIIIGGILLAVRLARISSWRADVADLERRVDAAERSQPQPELAPPPPPPPPPPGANFIVPPPGMVVAVF